VAGTVLTQSRTALLYGPAVMILLAWFHKQGVLWRTRQWFLAATTAALWIGTWAWPLLQQRMLVAATTSLSQRSAGSPRFKVWPILFDGLSQTPWWGFGWLQVGAAELAAAGRHEPVGELYLQGHDLFFELVLWAGYPIGLLLSAAIVVWYVSRVARARSGTAAVGVMVVSLVGMHALVELPHHYAYFLLPVGLWIGIVESEIGTRRGIDGRWNLLPIGVAAILLAGIWRDYPAMEEDFRLMRFENLRIATGLGDRAETPEAPFLSSLTAFLRFTRTPARAGMSDAEMARMRAVVRRYPYAPAMMHEAEALALNGHFDEAQALMIEIRHIHGDGMYQMILRDLKGRIEDGRNELIPLERSLPR